MSVRSYTKIWLHIIWPAFNHDNILTDAELRRNTSNFLQDYSAEKNIYMKVNYVMPDHVHGLIDLPTNKSIEDTMQLIKGASSFWINKQINFQFRWAKGYAAFSVSESNLDRVVKYILNQKEHHRKKSYTEEHTEFLAAYKVETKNG